MTLDQYRDYIVEAVVLFVQALISASAEQSLEGTTWTSWWRSPAYNLRVGGRPGSQHLKALAFDVSGPGAEAIATRWTQLGGVAIDETATKGHWHLQRFRAGSEPG